MPNRSSFWRGLRDAIFLAIPIGGFGLAFGVLAVQAGFPQWLAALTSLVVLSGAAQFAMVGLLAEGPAGVLVATTGLALRHIPMSAALRAALPPLPLHRRLALAHVLVDETFGLTVSAIERGEQDPAGYKSGADLALAGTWVASTVVGAYLGARIDPAEWGLDTLFPLMFLALAAPMVRTRQSVVLVAVSVAAGLVAAWVLPEAWQVTVAALVAGWVGSRLDA